MRGGKLIAALLAIAVLTSGVGVVAAATINWGDTNAPDRYLHEDSLTIAEHDRTEMSALLAYEDDSGEVAELPARVNSSKPAPLGVSVQKIEDSDYSTFPRVDGEEENSVNWTVASEWSTSSSASGSMSVSETTPAGEIEAVTFTATAGASDHGNATYSNFTISSDAAKRVPQVGANVDSLAAGANVSIRFQETDGDYVEYSINQSANATADGLLANSTGEGWVEQQRLSGDNMSVSGTGDGTLSSIDKVVVHVTGGDATVELFWLDAERKSAVELGTHYTDGDDDDTLREESETITDKNFAGEMRMSSMSELGSVFSSAIVYDKTVYDVEYHPEYVDSEDRSLSFTEASEYPNFDQLFEGYYRLKAPAPIDVSHGTISLRGSQQLPDGRYETLEYATDTGSTSFENATYTSYTFSERDKREEIATGISAGDNVIVHDEILFTTAEYEGLTSSSSAGAGGPVGSGSGGFLGGLLSFLSTLPGMVVAGVVTVIGGIKALGRRG